MQRETKATNRLTPWALLALGVWVGLSGADTVGGVLVAAAFLIWVKG